MSASHETSLPQEIGLLYFLTNLENNNITSIQGIRRINAPNLLTFIIGSKWYI
jgi:hypothetical protein